MRPSAYIIPMVFPLVGLWGLYSGGLATALLPVVAFVLIPAVELFVHGRGSDEFGEGGEHTGAHDMVLGFGYIMVWLGYFLLMDRLVTGTPSILHTAGLVMCSGILFGAVGINVAHELGHRRNKWVRGLGQALLFPSFYMHFTIEHNKGHHRWMATPKDPATARKGELLYAFWFRSTIGGWFSAWEIEAHRLRNKGWLNHLKHNQMLHVQAIQFVVAAAITVMFGWAVLAGWIAAAIVGFLLLETVNYVEHYGMLREKGANGRYERVTRKHSWTSDHPVSRALLFELPRHADHHAHAARPYGSLRHFDDAPQLPTGYAGMVLLALVPPLYFRVMDRAVELETQRIAC